MSSPYRFRLAVGLLGCAMLAAVLIARQNGGGGVGGPQPYQQPSEPRQASKPRPELLPSDETWAVLPRRDAFADRGTMLLKHLARVVDQTNWDQAVAQARLESVDEWTAYCVQERAKLREVLKLPTTVTDPAYQISGVLDKNDYRVEKLVYQAGPGRYVTANVYVPRSGSPPFPAVMLIPGHCEDGKALNDYQCAAQGMVRNGYVVLVYDPMGAGERVQLKIADCAPTMLRNMVEHCLLANPLFLTGMSYVTFEVADALAGIDYLAQRKDVDSSRIGVVGHSLGGWINTLLTAIDARIAVSVIAGCPLAAEFELGGEQPAESAHAPLGMIRAGIAMPNLLATTFPRPVCVVREVLNAAGGVDRSTRETVVRVRAIERIFGNPSRISLVELEGPHRFGDGMRAVTHQWLDQWLIDVRDVRPVPEGHPEEIRSLHCTKTGKVVNEYGPSFPEWVREQATAALPYPSIPTSARDVADFRNRLTGDVERLLNNPRPKGSPKVVMLGRQERCGVVTEKFALYTEADIYVPGRFFHAQDGSTSRIVILADGAGTTDENARLSIRLAEAGVGVMAVDLRGIGETRITRRSPADAGDGLVARSMGQEAIAAHQAMAIGRTMLAMRVFDLLRVVEHASAVSGDGATPAIAIIGRGSCGPVALQASLLSDRVSGTLIEDSLVSFLDLTQPRLSAFHISDYLPGVLQAYDLPHVAGALAPRPLGLISVVDGAKKKMSHEQVRREYSFAENCYAATGAAEALHVMCCEDGDEFMTTTLAWTRQVFQ